MATLPDAFVTQICELLRTLAESIADVSATEWALLEAYGETIGTTVELEELSNAREKLSESYSRLSVLLLRVCESQPQASSAMLELLEKAIEQAAATVEASRASLQEVRRIWRLT